MKKLPEPPEGACWFAVSRDVHALVDIERLVDIAPYKWRLTGAGYAISGNGQTEPSVYMHRLICNCPNDMQVDHINHNKLDNRASNLRVCTPLEQSFNKRNRAGSKSPYKGVYRREIPPKGAKPASVRFDVRIRALGENKNLGVYRDEIEAAMAYDKAAKELHGDFAKLNFP